MNWTAEQSRRLAELGAGAEELALEFADGRAANAAFQKLEKRLNRIAAEGIRRHLAEAGRPEGTELREGLSRALRGAGFTEVRTPLTVTRNLLERMGLDGDHALQSQIFWLDRNRAVRPMLAPNLYYLMVDLLRVAPRPVSIFEIGTCMRRESHGERHGEEFTMLNVVEMGLPLESRQGRVLELARLVIDAAGLPFAECRLEAEESAVYAETLDVVSPGGLELASTAMGPHPLDAPWKIDVPWVGLGFGIERLAMARRIARGETANLARVSGSLSYLAGFRLNIP
ncbi:MAG: pyrrolysine--tRNA(Pyl) ligase large subunit [Deltaproteobacteria bacterium]|nr:pyrrolysine--tRNA(Pyl) ligase large subunit [Deltaproteobacteria bacterium]